MLNYDSGAAVTALPNAVAGDLPLEKRGELRVASGAVIPNLGKIKMKSTDESGIERTLRGNITEVAKQLLSAAEVSKKWDSLLFEDGEILLERNTLREQLDPPTCTCGTGVTAVCLFFDRSSVSTVSSSAFLFGVCACVTTVADPELVAVPPEPVSSRTRALSK